VTGGEIGSAIQGAAGHLVAVSGGGGGVIEAGGAFLSLGGGGANSQTAATAGDADTVPAQGNRPRVPDPLRLAGLLPLWHPAAWHGMTVTP